MARSLYEIAADLEAIDVVLRNNAHAMIQTMAQIAGAKLPDNIPDVRKVPNEIVLDDGRHLQIVEIAAELRAIAKGQ